MAGVRRIAPRGSRITRALPHVTLILAMVSAFTFANVAAAAADWGNPSVTTFYHYEADDCWYNQAGIDGHGPSGYFHNEGYLLVKDGPGFCSGPGKQNPPYWMGYVSFIYYDEGYCGNWPYVDGNGYALSAPYYDAGYYEIGWCGPYGEYRNTIHAYWDPYDWWGLFNWQGTATHTKVIVP